MKLNCSDSDTEKMKLHFYYCNPYFYAVCTLPLFFIFWGLLAKILIHISTIFGIQIPEMELSVEYFAKITVFLIITPTIAFYMAHSIVLQLIDRKGSIIFNTETFTLVAKNNVKEIAYLDLLSIKIYTNASGGPEPEDKYWAPITVDYTILTKQKKYFFSSSLREGWKGSTFNSRYKLIKPYYSLDDVILALIQKCPHIEIIRECKT